MATNTQQGERSAFTTTTKAEPDWRVDAVRQSAATLQRQLSYLALHLDRALEGGIGSNEANAYCMLVGAIGELCTLNEAVDDVEKALCDEAAGLPNLDVCLAYQTNSNRWSDLTLAVARSGYFGDDCAPADWVERLDLLESLLSPLPKADDTKRDEAAE